VESDNCLHRIAKCSPEATTEPSGTWRWASSESLIDGNDSAMSLPEKGSLQSNSLQSDGVSENRSLYGT